MGRGGEGGMRVKGSNVIGSVIYVCRGGTKSNGN